jgi:hypothetical protein
MIRLLMVALFLEVGFVLLFVPWSAYWDRNYFVQALPLLRPLITSNFTRGAISGLGVINLAAGAVDLVSLFAARAARESVLHISPPHPSEE